MNQWKQLILLVVMAFFVGSPQLIKLRRGGKDNTDLGDGSRDTPMADFWLQRPELVKPSNESSRIKYLVSGCVRPVAWSKINHEDVVDALPGTSTRSKKSPLVRKWASTEGYTYVEFEVDGVIACIEDEYSQKELSRRSKGLTTGAAVELKARLIRDGKWTIVNHNYIARVSQVV